MSAPADTAHSMKAYNKQSLDIPLQITEDEDEFFKLTTGIHDQAELYAHITKVQREAYEDIWPYPCIRSFNFCRFKVANHPAYPALIARVKAAPEDAYFVDLGCCFGTDVRKVIVDGWPADKVLGAELKDGFIKLGHALFLDAKSPTVPPFVIGDIFSKDFYDPSAPRLETLPSLKEMTNLTPMKGRCRAIHAGSFFHLFSAETQTLLAHIVSSLIVHEKGTTIFGSHGGMDPSGLRSTAPVEERTAENSMYCHSPSSWKKMWEDILGKDNIVVEGKLVERGASLLAPPTTVEAETSHSTPWSLLVWSVTFV